MFALGTWGTQLNERRQSLNHEDGTRGRLLGDSVNPAIRYHLGAPGARHDTQKRFGKDEKPPKPSTPPAPQHREG